MQITISEAGALLLLVAKKHRFPLTLAEMTRFLKQFVAEEHPNLTIRAIDAPERVTRHGNCFEELALFVGALEEFGFSERLASYTLLTNQGQRQLKAQFRCLCWQKLRRIERRAMERLRSYAESHLGKLPPRTREQVVPPPSLVQDLLTYTH